MPTATIIDRLHTATGINEKMYDFSDRERFNLSITEFSFFAKKVLPQLKVMKKTIENFKNIKNSAIANYKLFFNVLDKYEEINFNMYVEKNEELMVLGGPQKVELKEQSDGLIDQMRNPFAEMYHWCKGEIYDISAICDAI